MSQITVRAVSLLMTSSPTLCALQFAFEFQSFEENFATLRQLIEKTPKNAIVLAPELCLSGYCYQDMDKAALFSNAIMGELKKLSLDKTIGLTLIEQTPQGFFNNFKLFHHGEIILTRAKAKLFTLGDENDYFQEGNTDDITLLEVDGIKIAVLICFELRFTELWEQIKGADIVLLPAFWGKLRKGHLETLSQALAIANQTWVLCANSNGDEMAAASGIISPFGDTFRDDTQALLMHPFEKTEIKKMRRYIDIGLQ
ncbi:MAG: carbon-nitrogen hydrolase family protein [Sulfurospirillaceae bacterium]|nr:carbon-nitrogen hydrolase family protein [Sulfurospirillaceae bacterium]MDD2825351.1 carbon-nitrogen hydrolase family protein [Sulfurospirillaceae bacterium]